MKVMTRRGKPLLKRGKVAVTSTGQPCGPCCSDNRGPANACNISLTGCVHYVSAFFSVDASEVAAGGRGGDFFDIVTDAGTLGVYADYAAGNWVAYGTPNSSNGRNIPMAGNAALTNHSATVVIKTTNSDMNITFCVDNLGVLTWGDTLGDSVPNVYFGSAAPAIPTHRSIYQATINTTDPFESNFVFPSNSFTGTVGPGITVTSQIRIDNDAVVDAYAYNTANRALFCDQGELQCRSRTGEIGGCGFAALADSVTPPVNYWSAVDCNFAFSGNVPDRCDVVFFTKAISCCPGQGSDGASNVSYATLDYHYRTSPNDSFDVSINCDFSAGDPTIPNCDLWDITLSNPQTPGMFVTALLSAMSSINYPNFSSNMAIGLCDSGFTSDFCGRSIYFLPCIPAAPIQLLQSQYKFVFPSVVRDFTLHWVERFSPQGGGSPVDTPFTESISAGATQSTIHNLDPPSQAGTTYVCGMSIE